MASQSHSNVAQESTISSSDRSRPVILPKRSRGKASIWIVVRSSSRFRLSHVYGSATGKNGLQRRPPGYVEAQEENMPADAWAVSITVGESFRPGAGRPQAERSSRSQNPSWRGQMAGHVGRIDD